MITTKGRYAIRFMIDMAEQPAGSIVRLDDVAKRQDISKKYLEIVVKMLVQGKLVKGSSGKGGGYRLLKEPSNITVLEILEMTEKTLATVACMEKEAEPCPRMASCKTLPMWKKYHALIHDFFNGITLEDLANEQTEASFNYII